MKISSEQLAISTGASITNATLWLSPIQEAMDRYQINTRLRCAAFLAEIGVESSCLTATRENLNYTPEGILLTFNRPPDIIRFSKADAQKLGRTVDHPANQIMIASIAYADRMGNGDFISTDGWEFRGGGPGQLTGRSNYRDCGHAIGYDLEGNPTLIEIPTIGALAFAWFWDTRCINPIADGGDIDGVSHRVNGGSNGLDRRRFRYQKALSCL